MSHIHIVTDSCADFRHLGSQLYDRITIVPHSIYAGRQSYREGVDISSEEFLSELGSVGVDTQIESPSPDDFAAQFSSLSQSTQEVFCLCVSSKLSRAYHNARKAAKPFLGQMDIVVIDSLSTSTGLGLLVKAAAEYAAGSVSMLELRRSIQLMIPCIYGAFFSDSMSHLHHFGRADASQAILGDMLGVKPIVALEDGDFAPMEKVGTRAQATERLIEFAGEFTELQSLDVLYGLPERAAEARQLCGRLATRFPGTAMSHGIFRPSLATLIGPDGIGVIVCEP
jgi:DegV family protein with EDD domain